MSQFIKLLPIFLLVNCFCSYAFDIYQELEASEVKAYSSTIAFSPNGKNILYMACNEMGAENKKSDTDTVNEEDNFGHGELVCDLKLETPYFAAGSYLRSCNDVQLLPRSHNVTLDRLTPPYFFFISETKVAIRYVPTKLSPSKTHFKIFDLANCTTITDFHFTFQPDDYKVFRHYLVPHDNYLEIFAFDDELCGNMGQCRVNYTLDGEMIGGPKHYPHYSVRNILNVNNFMPEKGYYLFGINTTNATSHSFNSRRTYVSHFDPFGKETELMRQNLTHGYVGQASFTNSHELFGVCWLVLVPVPVMRSVELINLTRNLRHDIVQCMQFDVTGTKANVTLIMDNPIAGMAVHNLPNGEMILVTGDVKVDNSSIARVERFHMYKIGSNGTNGQSIQVRGLDLKFWIGHKKLTQLEMAITENLNDELCVHIAGLGQNLNYPVPRIKIEDSQYVENCVPMYLLNNL